MSESSSEPGAEVGLPLHLHRVGDVEPLDGLRGVVHEQVGAGVALEVGEPDRGAPRAARVTSRRRAPITSSHSSRSGGDR